MTPTQPLVNIDNLRIAFGATEVVRGISFHVDKGECLAIVGESGSGKSVTARTLIGLTGPDAVVSADAVQFSGRDLTGLTERDWKSVRGKSIGFILQDALVALDQLRPVGKEINETLDVHGFGNRRARAERVIDLLALVGVPEPEIRARQRPHELSGGLRQRALIASALALDPPLLIADEPTTALDATVQAQILGVLGEAKARSKGIILISHDLAAVYRLADRVAVMRDGVIVETGPTSEVLENPRHEYTRSLLAAIPSQASRGSLLTELSGKDTSTATYLPSTHQSTTQKPALIAHGLQKSFRGPDGARRRVVRDVSFELPAGTTLGIVGESGSGKTTTARMALGLAEPDSGTVELNGHAWTASSPQKRRQHRHEISVIYQDPLSSFDPRWNVEHILRDVVVHTDRRNGIERGDVDARIGELLEQVGLSDDYRKRLPLRLSGGQRQRVAIARALAPRPSVIVCDEPVSALDVSIQARVLDLLTTLQRQTGISLLFISHDLGVIHHMSDQILVMRDGEVVERGDADAIFTDPQHPYTRKLLDSVPQIGQSAEAAA